jgi:TonB family protein
MRPWLVFVTLVASTTVASSDTDWRRLPVNPPRVEPVSVVIEKLAVDEHAGLTADEVTRTLRSHAGMLVDCYRHESRGVSGRGTVRLAVDADGSVTAARVASTWSRDALDTCVVASVRRTRFAAKTLTTGASFVLSFSK